MVPIYFKTLDNIVLHVISVSRQERKSLPLQALQRLKCVASISREIQAVSLYLTSLYLFSYPILLEREREREREREEIYYRDLLFVQ
jgi:hypothetical protein